MVANGVGKTKQAGGALRQAGAMGVIGQRQQLVRQQQRADDLVARVGRVGVVHGAHWSSSSQFGAMLVPRRRLAANGLTDPEQRAHLILQRRHRRRAIPCLMTMSPTRLRECLALPGWSLRELARRLEIGDREVRKMAAGQVPIPDTVSGWLEEIHTVWMSVPADLREGARTIGCDRGKYARRPHGFRPLTDGEAAQLQAVAAFHAARPWPDGWGATDPAQLQN